MHNISGFRLKWVCYYQIFGIVPNKNEYSGRMGNNNKIKVLCMCVIEMERLWATRWLVTGKITEAMVLNQSPIYAHVLLKMYTTWKVTVFKKKWNKSSAACWRTLDDEAFLKSRRGTSKTLNYIAPTHTILRHRQWSQMVEEKEITQYTHKICRKQTRKS